VTQNGAENTQFLDTLEAPFFFWIFVCTCPWSSR